MKIRHVDFSPDEFLVGVAGMPADEIGVYWVICCLIYSSGHAIPVDDERLKRLAGVSHQRLPHIVKSLVEVRRKLHLEGGLLSSKRVTNELARAGLRVSKAQANGEQGGRPPNKNNGLAKPDGYFSEKLTTNHQPPTKEDSSLRSESAHAEVANGRSSKRGTRLPSDWQPDEGDRQFAINLGLDPDSVAPEFRDYWHGIPGSKGVKLDWSGTWRNRCREIASRQPRGDFARGTRAATDSFASALRDLRFAGENG